MCFKKSDMDWYMFRSCLNILRLIRKVRTLICMKVPSSVADSDPWSGMRKNPDQESRIINPDYCSERLVTVFRVKNSLMRIRDLKSFWPRIRDGNIKIRDKHPGSATLVQVCIVNGKILILAEVPGSFWSRTTCHTSCPIYYMVLERAVLLITEYYQGKRIFFR